MTKKKPAAKKARAPKKPTIPRHLKEAVSDVLDSIRDMCDDDEDLVLLCLEDEEDKKVQKVVKQFGDEISWCLGYMRCVEDSLQLSPEEIVDASPPREEDDEEDADADADDEDRASGDDEDDEDFVADEDEDDEEAAPRRRRRKAA